MGPLPTAYLRWLTRDGWFWEYKSPKAHLVSKEGRVAALNQEGQQSIHHLQEGWQLNATNNGRASSRYILVLKKLRRP